MPAELEIAGCSIVLLGQFNPAIFHPSWFLGHKIITEAEFDGADLQLTHPEVAQMTIGQISLTVESQRCTVVTSSAPFVRAADFIDEVFGKLLVHTPLKQAGINTQKHFRLPNAEARHELGRRLAPIAPWGEWGTRLDEASGKDFKNGVQIVAMRELWFDEPWSGWLQTKVEPSTQIGHNLGVYVEKNYHIASARAGRDFQGPELVSYIVKKFDDVTAQGDWIDAQLFAKT